MKNYSLYLLNRIEVAKESIFSCLGNVYRLKTLVRGVDNHLHFSQNTKMVNYEIVIKGSNNRLEFGNHCTANGNHKSLGMFTMEEEAGYE